MSAAITGDIQILILEMQPEIVVASATHCAKSLQNAAAALKEMADALAIPITASAVHLSKEAPRLIPELSSVGFLVRSTISMLADEVCHNRITENRRNTIVLAGMSCEIALLHTALHARRAGYEVLLLIDCCGGLSSRTETSAVDQMRDAGVVVTNLSSVFTGLIDDMETSEGRAVMGVLSNLWSWNEG